MWACSACRAGVRWTDAETASGLNGQDLAVNAEGKNTVQQEQQVLGYRHLVWVVAKVDSKETSGQKVMALISLEWGKVMLQVRI